MYILAYVLLEDVYLFFRALHVRVGFSKTLFFITMVFITMLGIPVAWRGINSAYLPLKTSKG